MNIKLLVAYHKQSTLLKDDIFTPIHVGRALADKNSENYKWLSENMIGDDTGNNISNKNPSYNELTAIYWAWKNYDQLGNPDYIGLMHYRRHFIFDKDDNSIVKNVELKKLSSYLESIRYSKENIESLLKEGDFIYNRGRVSNIYEQYKLHHRIEDLERVINILKNKYPSYSKSANAYLKESTGCFANMFIFPRDMFFEYCDWLFSILDEFEKQVDLTNRRLFISERLTGIFVYHKINNGKVGIPLSSTFINEPLKVDVCLNVKKDNIFQTAVLLKSLVDENKYPCATINCHLLYVDKGVDTHSLDSLVDDVLKLDWVEIETDKYPVNQLPLYLGEIFPKINKILYLDCNTLIFSSIDIIWEACNTFEFMCVYSSNETKNKVYCLNLGLLRYHHVSSLVDAKKEPLNLLINKFPEQCKVMAPWVMFNVTIKDDACGLYDGLTRAEMERKNMVWTKCMLHYEEGLEPWNNLQCCYAIYWWDKAARISSDIPFIELDPKKMSEQSMETNMTFLDELKQEEKNNEKPPLLSKIKNKIRRMLKK